MQPPAKKRRIADASGKLPRPAATAAANVKPELAAATAKQRTAPPAATRHWSTIQPALHPLILRQLTDGFGYPDMTPVQAATIPQLLTHHDVTVQASTGSGKTLAFAVPTLQILVHQLTKRRNELLGGVGNKSKAADDMSAVELPTLPKHEVHVVVISPTRELAKQIYAVYHKLTQPFSQQIAVALMTGGVNEVHADRQWLERGGNILIATPGRLEHALCHNKLLNTQLLDCLVLDEADRLLELGFEQSIATIIHNLPKLRRTALFSATLNAAVKNLVKAGLRNNVQIDVQIQWKRDKQLPTPANNNTSTPSTVTNQVIPTSLHNYYELIPIQYKLNRLVQFLQQHGRSEKLIVFFLTCSQVNYFTLVLAIIQQLQGIELHGLHGKLTPSKRHNVYQKFISASSGVLLCTDVAARGIDITDVTYVVQYDPPQDPQMFTHRVGRTARMNRKGVAITYISPCEDTYVEYLRIQRIPIQPYPHPADDYAAIDDATLAIKQQALADRLIFNRAQSAFVSFVRAYKEHQLSQIFDWKTYAYTELAQSMGLLYLPQLKDLQHMKLRYDCGIADLPKPGDIKFADARLEAERVQKSAEQHAANEKEKHERIAEEQRRMTERQSQQSNRKVQKLSKDGKKVETIKRRNVSTSQQIRDEWEELKSDYKASKVKKGGSKRRGRAGDDSD